MEPLTKFKCEDGEVKVKVEMQDIDTGEDEDGSQEHENIVKCEHDIENEIIDDELLQNIKLENDIINMKNMVAPNARNIEHFGMNETDTNENNTTCYLDDARQKTGEMLYCNDFEKSFTKECNLTQHKRIHTGHSRSQVVYKKIISQGMIQQAHTILHQKLQCKDCDKSFSNKSNLTAHQRLIHIGDKPYQCKDCDKSFTRKRSLTTHKRIHTGEKPYQCNDCVKSFTDYSYLTKHTRIHTGEKPYQCKYCDKSFAQNSSLTTHKKIHMDEKAYQCNNCVKSFTYKSNLTKHARIHTGEKPYQCKDCVKSFTHKHNLIIHQRIHTGEKPYQCRVCDKSFTNKPSLSKHQRIHTRDKPVSF